MTFLLVVTLLNKVISAKCQEYNNGYSNDLTWKTISDVTSHSSMLKSMQSTLVIPSEGDVLRKGCSEKRHWEAVSFLIKFQDYSYV